MPNRIVLASGNLGKVKEIQLLLEDVPVMIVPQNALGVESVEETACTFIENALLKARHAANATGLGAIADDSGLEVDALNGAPGVHSARFAGVAATDADNIEKLLAAMQGVEPPRRTARFHSVVVYMRHAKDPCPLLGYGCWEGFITERALGDQGFGYDPVFLLPELGATAAQLPLARKNLMSHRARALAELTEQLRAAWGKHPR